MIYNPLLNQGTLTVGDQTVVGVAGPEGATVEVIMSRLKSNCQRAQADEVLQFLCFGVGAVLVGLGLLQMRRGGAGGRRAGAYVA
jgi:hypothetical protein